jgi:hypothetical protein
MVGRLHAVNEDGRRFQSLHSGIGHRIHRISLDVGTLYIPETGKIYRRSENLHHTDTEGTKTVQNCIRADADAAIVTLHRIQNITIARLICARAIATV